MINVFIDPSHPAIAIAIAAFIANLEEKFSGEPYEIIPIEVSDLKKTVIDLKIALNNEIKIALNSYSEESEDAEGDSDNEIEFEDDVDLIRQDNHPDSAHYALFGIYPRGEKEEKIIFNFVEKNADRILIWADHHVWPDGLVVYLKSQCSKIAIKNDTDYSNLLTDLNICFPNDWLEVEKAIMEVDFEVSLALRYWGSFLVSKSVGDNLALAKANDCLLFMDMVTEIVSGLCNEDINYMYGFFEPMLSETNRIIESITPRGCENEIFESARACGRPVGYLDLGEVEEYLDFRNIMSYGVQVFPWLFIISFKSRNRNYLKFLSTKMPIISLTEDYVKAGIGDQELLKAINIEVVNFKQ